MGNCGLVWNYWKLLILIFYSLLLIFKKTIIKLNLRHHQMGCYSFWPFLGVFRLNCCRSRLIQWELCWRWSWNCRIVRCFVLPGVRFACCGWKEVVGILGELEFGWCRNRSFRMLKNYFIVFVGVVGRKSPSRRKSFVRGFIGFESFVRFIMEALIVYSLGYFIGLFGAGWMVAFAFKGFGNFMLVTVKDLKNWDKIIR